MNLLYWYLELHIDIYVLIRGNIQYLARVKDRYGVLVSVQVFLHIFNDSIMPCVLQ